MQLVLFAIHMIFNKDKKETEMQPLRCIILDISVLQKEDITGRKLCRQGGVIQAGHTFSYEYSGSLHRRENEFSEGETI